MPSFKKGLIVEQFQGITLNQISLVHDVVQPPLLPSPRQLGLLNSVWTSMAPMVILWYGARIVLGKP